MIACSVATLSLMAIAMSSDSRNEVLAPGPLSVAHAQLLARGENTERCASCHAASNQTFGEWLQHAVDDELAHPSQSQLCMECHRQQIDLETALLAHTVDPQVLFATAEEPTGRRIDPTDQFACSTCHQEHHGAAHNLSAMHDDACQACHQQPFHGFATNHPEFERWPATRRTRIAFDHAAHRQKHFLKEKKEFACASCHQPDNQGVFQTTLGYEQSCAECHDSKLIASFDLGVPLFALPMIDRDLLAETGHDIGQWPDEAIDDFDGALPPLAKMLLAANSEAAEALVKLGVNFDFFDVDIDNPEELKEAATLLRETKRLLYELTTEGQSAIAVRLEAVLGRPITKEELSALAARLSSDTLAIVTQKWLTQLPQEFGEEPTNAQHPTDLPSVDREAARKQVVAGGWFRDELNLSIRYRPVGHADPWLTAWINLMAEACRGPRKTVAQPLIQAMMKPTAIGQCGSCHSLDRDKLGSLEVQWLSKEPRDARGQFTRFAHSPHLLQSQLRDCAACHMIDQDAEVMSNYESLSPENFVAGFQPIAKSQCAECHTRRAAGDGCLQCHRYHVRNPAGR